MPRIVSLLPSATEIICALGFEEGLVGVSHECDFPHGVSRRPALSATRRPLGTRSDEIDRGVNAILAEALSVYRVDTARLKALRPDIIVTQAQCEICAVSETDLAAALADWTGTRPRLVSLSPLTLGDVWNSMERVADALGAAERGARLVQRLRGRVGAIAAAAAGLARPAVALLDWIAPLMIGAEWMPELIALAGGTPLLAKAGSHAAALAPEALRDADPDVIVVAPCGFDMAQSEADMPLLAGKPFWPHLKAARSDKVYLADGNHYFNRPGPRLVESLEILAEILHPGHFRFGHEGVSYRAWRAPA